MTHAVETMAWTNQVPWHGLGFNVSPDLTPKQMLKAAKIDWKVEKRPVFMNLNNGEQKQIDGEYVLVRKSDNSVLTMVGETWKEIQNEEAFEFFSEFVKEGKMKMETAGSLWGGRYVWGLARIDKDFALGNKKQDEVHSYLLLMSPHVFGKAFVAQFTPIRVVCWNTLSYALGEKLKGSKHAFRMPHSTAFDEATKRRAAEALGLAVEQVAEFKEAAQFLSKKKANDEQVEEYFQEVCQFDPKEAAKKKDGEAREPLKLRQIREAYIHAPGQDLITARGTYWGALNAVTYYVDHMSGRERDTALKNAWVGALNKLKTDALKIALKRAA